MSDHHLPSPCPNPFPAAAFADKNSKQSTSKYLKLPQTTSKYLKVPESTLWTLWTLIQVIYQVMKFFMSNWKFVPMLWWHLMISYGYFWAFDIAGTCCLVYTCFSSPTRLCYRYDNNFHTARHVQVPVLWRTLLPMCPFFKAIFGSHLSRLLAKRSCFRAPIVTKEGDYFLLTSLTPYIYCG